MSAPLSLSAGFIDYLPQLLTTDEHRAFLEACALPAKKSIRFNRLTTSAERHREIAAGHGWQLQPIPWCDEGYWLAGEEAPGNALEHVAGGFYIQEASSMLPVAVLQQLWHQQHGLATPARVLDMAAAPGSKTTQLGSWLAGPHDRAGVDAWVVQREQVDPAEYVEMWLSDAGLVAGPEHTRRYDEWLSWFDAEGIDGVGFGWLSLRRTDAEPVLRLEEWTGEIAPPIGPSVKGWAVAADQLRQLDDEALLGRRLHATSAQVQQTRGRVGAEDPEQIVLQLQQGVRRTRQVDTVEAALVGACDGELTVGQILDALGSLLARDDLRASHLQSVRALVADGFLLV